MNPTIKYGWRDSEVVCSTEYLLTPIIQELKRLKVQRVLDLGCGNGHMSILLHELGFEVTACDADAGGIELAKSRNSGVTFHQLGVYDDPAILGNTDFDAVVSTEVIEHLFQPSALPRFAASVLKPGGSLIVSTPYHGYLKNLAIALVGKWDSHHHPCRDGGHIKFWSRPTLINLLESNGFKVEKFMGAGRYPLLWKSMILVARRLYV